MSTSSTAQGFISANFRMATDKKYVTNYAQWRSPADLDATMSDPQSREALTRASEAADSVEPILYQLREKRAAA
jgi:hypothetical protein